MKLALATFMCLTLTACKADEPETRPATAAAPSREMVFAIASQEDREMAVKAVEVLRASCAIDDIRSDLAGIKVTIEELGKTHYLGERYGWTRVVRVEPTFKSIDQIESRRWDPRRVGDHRFDFRLGGGDKAGITADKWIGQELCGMDVSTSETRYVAVPELRFLDALVVSDAVVATRDTPTLIDFAKLFRSQPSEVRALWGTPQEGKHEEEIYIFPTMRVEVRYQDGRVVSTALRSKSMSTQKLMRYARKTGRKFKVVKDDFDGTVYVLDTRMPDTRIDITRILGIPATEIANVLGAPTKENAWERDGYLIIVQDTGDEVIKELSIAFSGGITPNKQQVDLRKWGHIPSGSSFKVNGYRYSVFFDDVGMWFKLQ